MRKDKSMSLEEHIDNANDLAIATHHISKIFFRCEKHYPKTSVLMKNLYKILPGNLSGIFTKIKSELDEEYHKIASADDFKRHGHIYYSLDERYKNMTKD